MRGPEGLARLLYLAALLVARTWEARLHPKQETLVKHLPSYEIVTPMRVNEFGETFPHTHHFKRRKRSMETGVEPTPFRTHYRLSAYGQVFQLNLSADTSFIAPRYIEVHVGATERPPPSDLRHCFYRGHVNAQEMHTAIFSICGGLMGTFKSHDGEYFLEPLMTAAEDEQEDDHNKPHLIYKHEEFKKDSYQNSYKPCETSEEPKKSTLLFPYESSLMKDINVLQEHTVVEYASKNLSVESDRNNPHSRRKRFLSYPRYVEVMVTADARMVQHHGRNLQHYVLTLMSIVATIYKDSSIGNQINIMIVKLIVVHNEQEGPAISFNAATTLRNFCLWQQTQNIMDDAHPSHHDTAVLITREDICRAREKCDTLGLAELGTMCDPLRSCSISEENGLSAAFTIAHELGHVFNVPHDDSFKCKEVGIKHQYHVMAPTLNYHSNPWTWSKCSEKYITEFLDTGYGDCLLDKPNGRIYDFQSQLPGSLYDVNKQCELMFGPGSQVCPYMKQCKRLWCTSAEGIHKGCRTQHMPLADGTECGLGMHCRHGICVSKEKEKLPVDGEWGSWGPYSSCTRTCGGGIKSTTRLCNRPEPKHGGQYCVGRRMKFRSCNTDSCPKGRKDFREQQCSEFDGKHFNINGLTSTVRWLPKYSGISTKDRCKLFCRVSGTTSYYQLKDRVIDGTPCGTDTHDICVQGLCRQAGCDHVLNSKARRDKCGICGGDDSSCRTLSGTFNSAHYGYNIVVKIPIGATNLDIHQHSYSGKPEDDNYLALSNTQGHFFLNGNFVVSLSKKEISMYGTNFEYSGSNNTVERINSTGRLEEEILLQVLCVGNLYNPDIRYSFNVPVEGGHDLFIWDPYGLWQDCSKMCQGLHRRRVTCIQRSDHLVVSDQRCEHITRPTAVTEQCNTECELRWHNTGKSECSTRCGPGFRSLDIHCMKYSVSKGLSVPVDDKYCADQQKPPIREPCHGDCLLTSWHYTGWSECSRSCGRGARTREAFCMNNFGRRLADRECHKLPKIITESCNEFLCPSWTTSDWSECPVTCGKGMRRRQVWCQLNDEQLENVFCNPNSMPHSVTACELNECAAWQVGPWGACSVTCGHGYHVRAVKCVAGIYGTILDDNRECSAATRPRDSQECEMASCPETVKLWPTSLPVIQPDKAAQWRYGSWTPCSSSCGKGNRARYVSCRDGDGRVAEESFCAHLPRPEELSSCFSPCGVWQSGSWSPCTVTCGNGIVTRQVVCVNHHQQIDENYCDPEGHPAKEQECNMPPCQPVYHHNPDTREHPNHQDYPPIHKVHHSHDNVNSRNHHSPQGNQWRTGPWGACSSTCAGGFHRRVVVCQDEEGRSASFCDEALKPPDSSHCDSGPCPRWNYGDWGECTQTCGDGIKTRLVICQLANGQVLNDQNCEMLEKPPETAQCDIHACPVEVSWHRGPWKSCSVSCGKGVKDRDIYCVNNFQIKLGDNVCQHLKKPRTHKVCRASRCPGWKANRWNECSVTCGEGVQHRDVYCRLRGSGRVDEALCNYLMQPPSKRPCWLPACVQYYWLTDEWQDCSSSCQKRETYRKVRCVDENGIQVNESLCDPGAKPPSSKKCKLASCKYIVITVDTSQCPAGCYLENQQKTSYCVEAHNAWSSHTNNLRTIAYRNCPLAQSPLMNRCNVAVCALAASWNVGKWSQCSAPCGKGTAGRRVECMTQSGSPSDLCLSHLKPAARRICHAKDCEMVTSCKEIQIRKKMRKDGEYLLNIKGRKIKIFCSDMWLEDPKEYLTLAKGEADNFSEVYGYRLQNPYECPFNGSRRQDCLCRDDYPAAGYTIFRKIRIDLSSLEIKTTDFRFAHTILGKPVPFATAGDCYSAARCPQGQFGINLAGTGLRLSPTAKWIAQGNYVTVQIHKSQDDTKIYGRCGGLCGKCIPNGNTGLQLQIN
ncbi:A disintegrin and metalloproteinase with thrombospondin motifs 20 isoform X1 [Zootoca vivipara]|uniref:A disintegrin and metalloproteinase with thrombospondin motifs 20 isoform X1 n=2 Tax=Zootoca vivipara TaxID=8524 RepID=UPI00293BD5BE|nr:A disintegrin and metalloproteinase with thrombospondin motifs 20 isoform X1 [Zootoca vivipara]